MDNVFASLFVIAMISVAAFGTVWTFSRSRQLLNDWATRNDIELISADYCWIRRGPFFWTSSKGQTVYRITAKDQSGQRLTGWVRCGSFWAGLWGSKVEVRWDV